MRNSFRQDDTLQLGIACKSLLFNFKKFLRQLYFCKSCIGKSKLLYLFDRIGDIYTGKSLTTLKSA